MNNIKKLIKNINVLCVKIAVVGTFTLPRSRSFVDVADTLRKERTGAVTDV